jgi:hypothetical protein
MGCRIWIRPGSIKTPKGEPIDITPGLRSLAASVIEHVFGPFPCEIFESDFGVQLDLMASAASVFTRDEENIWKVMHRAIMDHHVITVGVEY